jgi:hypothetical protein
LAASTSSVTRYVPPPAGRARAPVACRSHSVMAENRSSTREWSESGTADRSSRWRSRVVGYGGPRIPWVATRRRSAAFTRASPAYWRSAYIATAPLR